MGFRRPSVRIAPPRPSPHLCLVVACLRGDGRRRIHSMPPQCPRGGTQRVADFCHICGLDFRTLDAPVPPVPPVAPAPPQPQDYQSAAPAYPPPFAPVAPVAPQPQPVAPTTCARCSAPLYFGQMQCANCGLDLRGSWATPIPPSRARSSTLPIAVGLLGAALLVAAAALFVITQNRGSSTAPTASPSHVAMATPTPTTSFTPTPTVEPSPSPSPSAADPNATAEPTPIGAWKSFTAPDGTWTEQFPGTSTPSKTTNPVGSGSNATTETIYAVSVGGAGYAVALMDVTPSVVDGQDPDALLSEMQISMAAGLKGTNVSSTSTTEGTYPARDVTMDAVGLKVNLRIWFVGTRFYMLLVTHAPAMAAYPQHFFAAFTLK